MYRFVDFFSQKAFSGTIHISYIIRAVAMQTVCLIITIATTYIMVLKGNLCMRKCFCINLVIYKLLSSKIIFITVKECTKMDSLLVGGVL